MLRVVVRLRPPTPKELESQRRPVVQVVDERVLVFDPEEPDGGFLGVLGSGTGRLSLGRAVTSPGHRLRRRLPEVSLRTAGHARRAHAHTRTARPVPPAHTRRVELRALFR